MRADALILSVAIMTAAGGAIGTPNEVDSTDPRFISVEDLSRFAKIGIPLDLDWTDFRTSIASYSPDGTRLVTVLRSGNPEYRTNDAEILMYRVADLNSTPHSEKLAEFTSRTNFQPIAGVQWLDNDTLVFAGSRGDNPTQIFKLDLRTRVQKALTRESTSILSFSITPSGKKLVAVVQAEALPPSEDPACLKQGCRVESSNLFSALASSHVGSSQLAIYDLESDSRHVLPSAEAFDSGVEGCNNAELLGGVSPDGRFVMQLCRVKQGQLPQWWAEYKGEPSLTKGGQLSLGGYAVLLIDLQEETGKRLSDSPWLPRWQEGGRSPIWIDGGRTLLLVGALESLDGVSEKEKAARAATRNILTIDPLTGRTEHVAVINPAYARIASAHWSDATQLLVVELEDEAQKYHTVMFRRNSKRWAAVKKDKPQIAQVRKTGIQLAIDQSLNDPPILMAVDVRTGARNKVLDPNPWLADRKLGRVEITSWKSLGRVWKGGIYYPPDYVRGERYPLLIQTHGFDERSFSLWGEARNFVGQALAAHDIVVLQLGEATTGVGGTPDEWFTVQRGYEAAIDHLENIGLIDPTKVGIVGWSRSGGPYVGHTLTHSEFPFAAAVLTDTGGHGYWWWLADSTASGKTMEADFGGAPIAQGLAPWLSLAPNFNFDRVRTPVLMWAHGAAGMWDWYSGLRRSNVPVEYWLLPDGQHDLFKVSHRIHMNQLLVDWFCFWLKNEENANEKKIDQYTRWRQMRIQQSKLLESPRRPLLEWRATPVVGHDQMLSAPENVE